MSKKPKMNPDGFIVVDRMIRPDELARLRMARIVSYPVTPTPEVPNRLFGSYINEEGEVC